MLNKCLEIGLETVGGGANCEIFDNGKDLLARVEVDSKNLFGAGTGNHYLRLSDTNFDRIPGTAQIIGVDGLDLGETGQISFDFYKPSIPAGGSEPLDEGNGYLFRIGVSRFNSGTAFAICIQKEGLFATVGEPLSVQKNPFAPFANDERHHLDIIFNHSTLEFEYGNGHRLEPGRMDVWLDGALVGIGLPRAGGLSSDYSGPLKSFSFGQKLNFVGELLIDNLEISREVILKE